MADISSIKLPGGGTYDLKDKNAQLKITANGILKGDGQGGVTAAQAGTDYATPAQLAKEIVIVDIPAFSALPQTVNNAAITENHVVLSSKLGTSWVQGSDWTVVTSNGSLTISGTCYGSTTLRLILGQYGTTI